jgi:2-iminobutanoate/2-iminopropanoate deaminase
MSETKFLDPTGLAPPMGPFSVGVLVGDMVFTAGQLPLGPDGRIVGPDIRSQTRQCFANIETVLADVGLGLSDVVKLTVWLRDIADLGAVADVRRELFTDPHPVSTTVEVSKLPNPDALIEIDAVAVESS